MTNRNHKFSKGQTKKENNKANVIREERREGVYGNVIAIVISGLAFLVSCLSLAATIYFSYKEYEYKLDPEVAAATEIGAEAYETGGKYVSHVYSDGIKIQILNKNNLEKAYLIYSDSRVEKLDINDVEDALETKLNENIKMNKYDLQIGEISYQYCFLYLEGLDGGNELTLIYAKSGDGEFEFNEATGIKVWGLANSNKDDPKYEGERIMAEQYLKIMEESAAYIL